jgi:hypothetical protein
MALVLFSYHRGYFFNYPAQLVEEEKGFTPYGSKASVTLSTPFHNLRYIIRTV